jgi:hypothetical protein
MITIEKLVEYESYRGYYDGFYIQKVKNKINLTSDEEWYLIENLIQDIRLVKRNLASSSFAETLEIKLKSVCENIETVEFFKRMC